MSKKPLVSVVFPAYNEEKIIGRVLKTMAAQDYPNFEVIVVDNNSTDSTHQMVADYIKAHPNFRIVTEKKPGIGVARQTGHAAAKGEIMVGTDADVELPHDWLSRIANDFEQRPKAVGLVGTYVFYDAPGAVNFFFHFGMILVDTIVRLIVGNYPFRGNNFAVRSDIYQKSGGFNPNVSALEDLDLSLRVAEYGKILYRPSLEIKMTSRRFRGQIVAQTVKRLRAFYWRGIRRNPTEAPDWDIIR